MTMQTSRCVGRRQLLSTRRAVPLPPRRRPTTALPRLVAASSSDDEKRSSGKDQPPSSSSSSSSFLGSVLRVQLSPKEIDVLGAMLRDVGLDTAPKLRGFLLRRSGQQTLFLLLDIAINSIAALCSLYTFQSLVHSQSQALPPPVNFALSALSAFGVGWFSFTIAGDSLALAVTLITAARFGLAADSVLKLALRERSQDGRGGPLDSAMLAQAAMRSAEVLQNAMRALQARQASLPAPDTNESLAAYFTLSASEERGFKPAGLDLSPMDATAVARAFDAYDKNSDGFIDQQELRNLVIEVTAQPCTDEEARTAMAGLDENGDGLLSFEEFSRWWADVKLSAMQRVAEETTEAQQ
jgi:hypothetical protein